jgi:hypothetical protein
MRSLLRIVPIWAVLACLPLTAAKAGALEDAFPSTGWQRGKVSNTSFWIDCVAESCGKPAHVMFTVEPSNKILANKIRSGEVDRAWAEKLADSYRKSNDDKVQIISFTVQTGPTPGWSMIYQCHCEGTTNYISARIIAGEKSTLTVYSSSRAPESAQENMNKLVEALLGPQARIGMK